MAEDTGDAVRVAVRVRPLSEKELAEQCRPCLRVFARENQVVLGKDRGFTFDFVFGERAQQSDLYDACCASLVAGCLSGYNGTIMAYGQTGSGKTHTMGSAAPAQAGSGPALADHEAVGIIPRALEQLFAALGAAGDDADDPSAADADGGADGGADDGDGDDDGDGAFHVDATFLEIYNEEVKDLLHPHTPARAITIRETPDGQITVAGARAQAAPSLRAVMRLLNSGAAARTTGATLMNATSSRSHSLFTIALRHRVDGVQRRAKLHLVDLAGSERAKKTGATGGRFKESVTINQGLLALGNVISALGDERRRGSHVPYRESKLTRLLQDSLGGNSRTLMVACVSPADTNLDETLNTLRYANRARNITNKPVRNVLLDESRAGAGAAGAERLTDLMEQIESLQRQLHAARAAEPPPRALLGAGAPAAVGARAGGGALTARVIALLEAAAAGEGGDAAGGALAALSASMQDGALLALLREHDSGGGRDAGAAAAARPASAASDAAAAEEEAAGLAAADDEATAAADEAEAAIRSAADSVALSGLHRQHALLLLKPLWEIVAAGASAPPSVAPSAAPTPAPVRGSGGGFSSLLAGAAAAASDLLRTPPRPTPSDGAAASPTCSALASALAGALPPARIKRDILAVSRQARAAEDAARAALDRALAWTDTARAALGKRRAAAAGGGGGEASRVARRERRRRAMTGASVREEEDGTGSVWSSRGWPDSRPTTARSDADADVGGGAGGAALAAAEARAAELAAALADAQTDLRRDEEIFAERAAELLQLRRANADLGASLAAARAEPSPPSPPTEGARARAWALRSPSRDPGSPPPPPPPRRLGHPNSPRRLPQPPPQQAQQQQQAAARMLERGDRASSGSAGAGSALQGAAWQLAEALEDDFDSVAFGGDDNLGHGGDDCGGGGNEGGAASSAVAQERRLLLVEQRQLSLAEEGEEGGRDHAHAHDDGADADLGASARADADAADGDGDGDAQLTRTVASKEAQIAELVRQEAEARAALLEAEARSHTLAAELARLRADLEAAQRAAEGGGERAAALAAAYAAKLAEAEAQVLALRERQRATAALARDKTLAERRLREAATELAALRAQCDGLRRRAEASAASSSSRRADSNATSASSAREIAELRKRVQAREKRIRELEAAGGTRSARAVAAAGGGTPVALPLSKSRSPPAAGSAGRAAGGAGRPASGEVAHARRELDGALDALVAARNASAQLAKEEARLADAQREREGVKLERERVRARALDGPPLLVAAFDAAATELARAEAQLARARARDDDDADSPEELAALHVRHAAAEAARAKAADAVARGAERCASELRALDERIDSLDAAIEWQEESTDERRAEAARAGGGDGGAAQLERAVERLLARHEQHGGGPLSQVLLKEYLAELLDARRALRAREGERDSLRAQLAEATEQLNEGALSLSHAEREHERRLDMLRQAHELERANLARKLQQRHPVAASAASRDGGLDASADARSAEQLARALREQEERATALERDNFFFKEKARELKRQLKDALANGGRASRDGAAAAADGELEGLARENAQLVNELANLKEYLLRNPAAQMVRVSKREQQSLLSPADGAQLRGPAVATATPDAHYASR